MAGYGYEPYRETALQDALRLGGFSGNAALRRVAADRMEFASPPSGENTDTSTKPGGKSILGRIGAIVGSDQFRGAVAALAQPIQGGDPLGNFARSATAGLGTRAAIRSKRTEEATAAERLDLEKRRVAADELRASREKVTEDPAAWRNYQKLLADGYTKEKAAELAFGATAQQRASLRETPQGEEDVTAIAGHYGVSTETARVMKVSGATRLRRRLTTVNDTDPVSGKPRTRTIEVNEPVQLLTERELSSTISTLNDAKKLERMAAGDMPDEVPDDAGLHARLQALAQRRLQAISAPSGALRIRGD